MTAGPTGGASAGIPLAQDGERTEAIVRAALAQDPSIAPFRAVVDLAGPETATGRRLDAAVNTRWTDEPVERVGPEPGPDAHVVYWSQLEDDP
jgi:hypothetical protein